LSSEKKREEEPIGGFVWFWKKNGGAVGVVGEKEGNSTRGEGERGSRKKKRGLEGKKHSEIPREIRDSTLGGKRRGEKQVGEK